MGGNEPHIAFPQKRKIEVAEDANSTQWCGPWEAAEPEREKGGCGWMN